MPLGSTSQRLLVLGNSLNTPLWSEGSYEALDSISNIGSLEDFLLVVTGSKVGSTEGLFLVVLRGACGCSVGGSSSSLS